MERKITYKYLDETAIRTTFQYAPLKDDFIMEGKTLIITKFNGEQITMSSREMHKFTIIKHPSSRVNYLGKTEYDYNMLYISNNENPLYSNAILFYKDVYSIEVLN